MSLGVQFTLSRFIDFFSINPYDQKSVIYACLLLSSGSHSDLKIDDVPERRHFVQNFSTFVQK